MAFWHVHNQQPYDISWFLPLFADWNSGIFLFTSATAILCTQIPIAFRFGQLESQLQFSPFFGRTMWSTFHCNSRPFGPGSCPGAGTMTSLLISLLASSRIPSRYFMDIITWKATLSKSTDNKEGSVQNNGWTSVNFRPFHEDDRSNCNMVGLTVWP